MEPQSKRKRYQPPTFKPFPTSVNPLEDQQQYTGYFTGISVEIFDPTVMAIVHENGCFGVGSHTKSTPAVLWPKQKLQTDESTTDDSLVLFAEEAFFMHFSLKCLTVLDLHGVMMSSEQLFQQFRQLNARFVEHFVAYLYLRSKNWIIKSGLKFGGDFLLYKDGPRFYHASYVVLVSKAGENQIDTLSAINLQGHHRIAEASKKELLLIEVTFPNSISSLSPTKDCLENLHLFTATEVIPKRVLLNRDL